MPSTVVASMQYDEEHYVLTVRFVTGSVYKYLGVPPEVYEVMRTSGSKGTYLNTHIKGNYAFKKIS